MNLEQYAVLEFWHCWQNLLSMSIIYVDTTMNIFSSDLREHHKLVFSCDNDETKGLDRQLDLLNSVNLQLQQL